MEGDALICDERRDPVPVRLAQLIAAECVCSFLEVGTRDVADCKGDVPLRARLPYISSAGLEEGILTPAGLKDGDCGLVVTEQFDEIVHKLRIPQLDGQGGVESLEVADEGIVPEYSRWEDGMIGSAHCEGSTAGQASVDVQGHRVPVILVNEESVIGGGEEPIKSGKIIAELGGEGERSLFWALPQGV